MDFIFFNNWGRIIILSSINFGILYFINGLYIDPLLQFIAVFLQFIFKVLTPLLCIFLIIFKDNKKKNFKIFCLLFFLFIIQAILFNGSLLSFSTLPTDGSVRIATANNFIESLDLHSPYPSFPSGTMSIIVSLGCLFKKYYPKFTPVFVLSIFVAGFLKLYLGLHTPIDLIAGVIFGYILYKIVDYIFNTKLHFIE